MKIVLGLLSLLSFVGVVLTGLLLIINPSVENLLILAICMGLAVALRGTKSRMR